jgi:general secretion pathway protein L
LAAAPARLELDIALERETEGVAGGSVTIPVGTGPAPRRRSERAVAGVLAALIVATTGLLVARSWFGTVIADEVTVVEADIAAETAGQKRLQDSIDRDIAARTQERQARSPQLPTFQIIEALSRILPDSVYLASINMEKNKLQIAGTAKGDTASLIPLLEHSPFFSNASFSAPTTRAATGSGSHFAIELTVNDRPSLKPIRHVGP